jgi:hypothetical protein
MSTTGEKAYERQDPLDDLAQEGSSSCVFQYGWSSSSSSPSKSSAKSYSENTAILSRTLRRQPSDPERYEQPTPDDGSVTVPELESSDLRQLITTPLRGRLTRRRCVSCAEASHRARAWFSSPDRFITQRAESIERESVFRVSRSPHSLSPGERNTRQRDNNVDPFRCTNRSQSRDAVSVLRPSPSHRQSPPHFTPSFVHGQDASPGPVDADQAPSNTRVISVGAIWNVGGATVAQGGPRPGVHDGHGGLLASGTNGPMHTAHFLEKNGSNQDVQQHERRLALALSIDQASRVLGPIATPAVMTAASLNNPQLRPFRWRNNSWEREEGADRKLP